MKTEDPIITRQEAIFITAALTVCVLIFASACLYLGYKIGALL